MKAIALFVAGMSVSSALAAQVQAAYTERDKLMLETVLTDLLKGLPPGSTVIDPRARRAYHDNAGTSIKWRGNHPEAFLRDMEQIIPSRILPMRDDELVLECNPSPFCRQTNADRYVALSSPDHLDATHAQVTAFAQTNSYRTIGSTLWVYSLEYDGRQWTITERKLLVGT